jgi:hypothetical protein
LVDRTAVAKLKIVLFMALVAGLVTMWLGRAQVIEAYTDTDPVPLDIRLSGIDLDHELTPMGPSPYTVETAPDTRNAPIVLAFSDESSVEEGDGEGDGAEPEIELTGGTSRLKGVVSGPEGRVAGATVRIERHTVDGSVAVDVTADAKGRWSYNHLLGGRYRLRAWHPDGYASAASEVLFLAQHETKTFDLGVEPLDDEPVLTFADAGDIYAGLTGTVAITVTTNAIDEAGLLAAIGLPGEVVSLEPSSGVTVTPAEVITDVDGVARFQVRCLREGSVTAIARHQEDEIFVILPDCIPQPESVTSAATTTIVSTPSTQPETSTTSSSSSSSSSSSTTTTGGVWGGRSGSGSRSSGRSGRG